MTSRSHIPAMPDLPTIAEVGLPGFEFDQWYGVLAALKTPPARASMRDGESRTTITFSPSRHCTVG